MGRRSRRRSSGRTPATDPPGGRAPTGGHETVEVWPDGEWVVRQITGSASTKPYRCPGCDQQILPATPHVVAWPVDPRTYGGAATDERRHWHTTCWRARGRRGPR